MLAYNPTQDLISLIKNQHDISPQYIFKTLPDAAVFRHKRTKKWFGVMMNIPKNKLPFTQNPPFCANADGKTAAKDPEVVHIINLKSPPDLAAILVDFKTIFPAYHMNKQHWISVLLTAKTIKSDLLADLIAQSFELTKK